MTMRRRAMLLGSVIAAFLGASGLARAVDDPSATEWRVLGGGSDVTHHSRLDQITPANVGKLGLAWIGEIPSRDGLVGNPLVAEGVVYQSGPAGRIYATEIRTGKLLWRFAAEVRYDNHSFVGTWSTHVNRGLALWRDKVIVATGDCRLVAVDRRTGAKVWEAVSCDSSQQYGITGAPRVGGDKVFIGNNCGDTGQTRGYVDAFDAATGRRVWRFYTVPGDPAQPPEDDVQAMAGKTWGTGWYEKSRGCGSVWDAITYDEKLKQLYVGTGGPAPWNPAARAADAGDELFSNSIVALDADTGRYVWHYKATPRDGWNLDSTMQMTVAELPVGGEPRRVLLQAPKNGFFYVLDARTGGFLSAGKITDVNWASHIDPATGRPVTIPAARYWERPDEQTVVSPGPLGARSWHAMSYDAARRLVFMPVVVAPTLMRPDPKAMVGGMAFDMYYGLKDDPRWRSYGKLVAWDPVLQAARWEVRRPMAMNGGTLSTASGLVFQGTADGRFEAFRSADGRKLWSYDVAGSAQAAPTTVMVDGEQFILLAVGNAASANVGTYLAKVASTAQTRTASRLLAFKLGGTARLPARRAAPVPRPPLPRPEGRLAGQGKVLFERHECAACHGLEAVSGGGTIPDLRRASGEAHELFGGIVVNGLRSAKGMPAFPDLSLDDVEALQAYVLSEAWQAYDADRRRGRGRTPAARPAR